MRVLLLLVTGLGLSNGGMDVDCITQPADPSCGEPAAPRPHSMATRMATRTEPLPDAFRRFGVAASFQLNASQCIAGIKMNCDMSGGLSMLSSHAALQSACHRMAASNRRLMSYRSTTSLHDGQDHNAVLLRVGAMPEGPPLSLGISPRLTSPAMSSCLWQADYVAKPYCRPFSVLKDSCIDMAMMGCDDTYTPMCKAGRESSSTRQCTVSWRLRIHVESRPAVANPHCACVVQQCNSTSLANVLPSTFDTRDSPRLATLRLMCVVVRAGHRANGNGCAAHGT